MFTREELLKPYETMVKISKFDLEMCIRDRIRTSRIRRTSSPRSSACSIRKGGDRMAYEILMPQLGLTMEEGTVSSWLKHEGDAVKAGEAILDSIPLMLEPAAVSYTHLIVKSRQIFLCYFSKAKKMKRHA